jgi:hypothetical protein
LFSVWVNELHTNHVAHTVAPRMDSVIKSITNKPSLFTQFESNTPKANVHAIDAHIAVILRTFAVLSFISNSLFSKHNSLAAGDSSIQHLEFKIKNYLLYF